MTTNHDKSLSRMSVEMTEDAAGKVASDNTEVIRVNAQEENKIRRAVRVSLSADHEHSLNSVGYSSTDAWYRSYALHMCYPTSTVVTLATRSTSDGIF